MHQVHTLSGLGTPQRCPGTYWGLIQRRKRSGSQESETPQLIQPYQAASAVRDTVTCGWSKCIMHACVCHIYLPLISCRKRLWILHKYDALVKVGETYDQYFDINIASASATAAHCDRRRCRRLINPHSHNEAIWPRSKNTFIACPLRRGTLCGGVLIMHGDRP